MDVSARSFFTAAVAAIAASAIAIAPAVIPKPSDETVPAIHFPAAPVTSQQMLDLLAAAEPGAPSPVSSAPLQTAVSPVPLNAAGDFIVNTWNAVLPWIDYGVNLVDYVLGFIPLVSLVGDQINIFYYNLIRPVTNSFVVDLVAPVVDAPLDPASYINGLITLGSVAFNGLINTAIAEFNYILGAILPPLPPLPPLSVVAAAAASPTASVANIPATVKAALGTLTSVGKGTVAPATGAPADVADDVSGTNAVAPEAKPVSGTVSVHPDVGGVRVHQPLVAAPRDTAKVSKTATGSRASATESVTHGVSAAAGSVPGANTGVHEAGKDVKTGRK